MLAAVVEVEEERGSETKESSEVEKSEVMVRCCVGGCTLVDV